MLNPFVIFLRRILALYNKIIYRFLLCIMRPQGRFDSFLWSTHIKYLRRYRKYSTQYIIPKKEEN